MSFIVHESSLLTPTPQTFGNQLLIAALCMCDKTVLWTVKSSNDVHMLYAIETAEIL